MKSDAAREPGRALLTGKAPQDDIPEADTQHPERKNHNTGVTHGTRRGPQQQIMINRDRRAENHHFGVEPGKEKGGDQRLSYAQWRTGDRSSFHARKTSPFGQFQEMK